MRPQAIVVLAPSLDDELRLFEGREDLFVQQLVAQPSVEALDITVVPWAATLDVSGP